MMKVGSIREERDEFDEGMILTMNLLIGGTPIVLYGEEISLNQVCFSFDSSFNFNFNIKETNPVDVMDIGQNQWRIFIMFNRMSTDLFQISK